MNRNRDKEIMNYLPFVLEEMQYALAHYKTYQSPHEAYGVLAEEVAEFFDYVRAHKPTATNPEGWVKEDVCKELFQVAAVALRTVHDLELFDQFQKKQKHSNRGNLHLI
jgi:NTP pyrophosphatase (non-canonical NTP hydrolase)